MEVKSIPSYYKIKENKENRIPMTMKAYQKR